MESYGIIIFDCSKENDIDNFKKNLNNAAKEVADASGFDLYCCTLYIEQEFTESGQCIIQYLGASMAERTLTTLFKMLSSQNTTFARANDAGDEDPILNFYFVDKGVFTFQPLWDADINLAEEEQLENGVFLQNELDTKGPLYYVEGVEKWMSGVKISPDHKLIKKYITNCKDWLIEMYNK